MKIDEQRLMAFVDGQLDPAEAARVEAAIAADPALAAEVARQRALADALRSAYAAELDEPVPAQLQALLADERAAATPARVLAFEHGRSRAGRRSVVPPGFGPPAWLGLAAVLVLGLAVGTWFGRGGADFGPDGDGHLVARGALASALEHRLAADAPQDVAVGLSFRDRDGRWCRSFVRGGDAPLAGLACRDRDGRWRLPVLGETTLPGDGLRQAAAALPPAVLAEVDARLAGEPADAEAERRARDAGWR